MGCVSLPFVVSGVILKTRKKGGEAMAGQDQKRCTLPEGGRGLSPGKQLCSWEIIVSCRVDLLGEVDGGIPLATVKGAFGEVGRGARGVEEVEEVEGRPVLQFMSRVQLECPGVPARA